MDETHLLPRGRRWSGLPGRKGLATSANGVPLTIALTRDAGRLFGLFLAEGCCDPHKLVWTFGAHEEQTLVRETVELIQTVLGATAHVQPRPNNSINVVLYGIGWSKLFSSLCGNGAGFKRMHSDLTAGGRHFLHAALEGWLAGDGHVRPNGAREGITISHDLALNMYDIAQALHLRPVLDWREATKNDAAETRQPRWTVTMAAAGADNYSTQDDTHVWRRLCEVTEEPFTGPVYNLSVEGDESYVAEGIGVHNCTGNGAAGVLATEPYYTKRRKYSEDLALKIYREATRIDVIKGNYPPTDTGSTVLAAMKAAVKLGLCSGYTWCFGLDDVLRTLSNVGPVEVGLTWHSGFDTPDENGLVKLTGGVEGGHAFELIGVDAEKQVVWAVNSWGTSWGKAGRFCFSWNDLDTLLKDDGEAVTVVK